MAEVRDPQAEEGEVEGHLRGEEAAGVAPLLEVGEEAAGAAPLLEVGEAAVGARLPRASEAAGAAEEVRLRQYLRAAVAEEGVAAVHLPEEAGEGVAAAGEEDRQQTLLTSGEVEEEGAEEEVPEPYVWRFLLFFHRPSSRSPRRLEYLW